jgi:hypothetical protein
MPCKYSAGLSPVCEAPPNQKALFWLAPAPQLRDILHNDRFGRQVTVLAEGRRVAASAIHTALFQLCHEFCRNPRMKDSSWYYIKVLHAVGEGQAACQQWPSPSVPTEP